MAVMMASSLCAQIEDDLEKEFQSLNDSMMLDFSDFFLRSAGDFMEFRRQANEDFAGFLAQLWDPEPTQPAIEPPVKPKPLKPLVTDASMSRPAAAMIPFEGRPVPPKPIDRPQPMEPIRMQPREDAPLVSFHFFETPMSFHVDKTRRLKLKDATEQSVAELWKQLSDPCYDNLIAECLQNSKRQNLCDWGYMLLTQQVAEEYCGAGTNEAVVMHMYLLVQSGYQMRIGRANDRLCLLFSAQSLIYRYKYFNLDGEYFYIYDKSLEGIPFHVFKHAFPREKSLSLALTQPKLNVVRTEERSFASKRWPEVKVTVGTNQNLIDFYNSYPLTSEWRNYSKASLSETLKESLYPALKAALAEKTEVQAVNILLNFIQTGFGYQTDQQQFGYERPLFPDEVFFYPYCDCEDRSILFSCLVRELLDLDVVLLDYPEHLATAVCFNEEVAGDYLMVEGKKYLVCDPTYVGAQIGRCMPQCKAMSFEVQRF